MEVKFIKWDRGLGCACSIRRSIRYMATSIYRGSGGVSESCHPPITEMPTWPFSSLDLD